MTVSNYTPQPGTVAYRALAHLETLDRDAELSSAQLAEAINAPAAAIQPSMLAPLRAGKVFARQKGGHQRSPMFWSLVDHSSTHSAPRGSAAPTPGVRDDDESNCGRARRLARGSDDDRHAAGGRRSRAASDEQHDDGVTAHHAGLLRAQPPRAAHQGTAEPELTEGRDSQNVVKAEPARADATDRETPAMRSPVGGPTGAGQPAAAGPVEASPNTPQQGANRDASAGQSHVAGGSASPAGRGADGPTARGAAPDLSSYVSAIAERHPPDPAPATTKRGLRVAAWSTGELAIEIDGGEVILFGKPEADQVVAFCRRIGGGV